MTRYQYSQRAFKKVFYFFLRFSLEFVIIYQWRHIYRNLTYIWPQLLSTLNVNKFIYILQKNKMNKYNFSNLSFWSGIFKGVTCVLSHVLFHPISKRGVIIRMGFLLSLSQLLFLSHANLILNQTGRYIKCKANRKHTHWTQRGTRAYCYKTGNFQDPMHGHPNVK